MTDLEIVKQIVPKKIVEVGKELGLKRDDLILYGDDKAKVKKCSKGKEGKLILVTAISPTPQGEGKTTVAIGLADAIRRENEKVCLTLREPSLGPVFGRKGGATGGGYSQVIPMEEINLHFTGDFHAITSCNNLISAAIYNHIYQGNELGIQKVFHQSCLDVNDRSLRAVDIKVKDKHFQTSFQITAASSIMALFSLATDENDLRKRLGRMILALGENEKMITVEDLKLTGALMALLKEAIRPNLVQTLEGTPTLIHGGPFANIAHGCNSVIATKLALSLASYCVTEAGFGADLGAEKFFNIKCSSANLKPNVVVLVVTAKALKYHGSGDLMRGLSNLDAHLTHLSCYHLPIIVAINQFEEDSVEDLSLIKNYVCQKGYACSLCSSHKEGGKGALELAKLVLQESKKKVHFQPLYTEKDTILEKMEILGKKVYFAKEIKYSQEAKEEIERLKHTPYYFFPICVSKTQYSISGDAKKIGFPKDNTMVVQKIQLETGAGFVRFVLEDIYEMPGLPKHPNYEKIEYKNGEILGLF